MDVGQIQAGHFYVGKKIDLVREVTSEMDGGDVLYRSYELDTGKPFGYPAMCSKRRMSIWAEREATPEEAALMNDDEAARVDTERVYKEILFYLQNAPADMLLDEVRRRGLKLDDE